MRTAIRTASIALAGAATFGAGVAVAAPHAKNGFYAELKGTPPTAVVGFSLKNGKLYDFTHFDRCAADMIQTPIDTKLAGGAFTFKKTVTAEGGKGKYAVNLTGHFTSATTATGTVTYKKTKGDQLGPAGCHSKVSFTVKRDGPPRPPNAG